MPRQYGSDRLNYGSGLAPRTAQQQLQQQQSVQQQNNAKPMGRTMFPPNNRFRIGPGAFENYGVAGMQSQAVGDPRMNPANQGMNQTFDPNVPQVPTAADTNGWRFANQNGTWWYWMPGQYWVSWDGGQWNRYTPVGPPTNTAAPARTAFTNPAPAVARPSMGPSTTATAPAGAMPTAISPAAPIPNFQ
jgi:hypothetical protein